MRNVLCEACFHECARPAGGKNHAEFAEVGTVRLNKRKTQLFNEAGHGTKISIVMFKVFVASDQIVLISAS